MHSCLSASIRQGAFLSNTVWSSNWKGSLNIYWKSNWKHMDEWSCTWIPHSCHRYHRLSGSMLQVSRRGETVFTHTYTQLKKVTLKGNTFSCVIIFCALVLEHWMSSCSKASIFALALHSYRHTYRFISHEYLIWQQIWYQVVRVWII